MTGTKHGAMYAHIPSLHGMTAEIQDLTDRLKRLKANALAGINIDLSDDAMLGDHPVARETVGQMRNAVGVSHDLIDAVNRALDFAQDIMRTITTIYVERDRKDAEAINDVQRALNHLGEVFGGPAVSLGKPKDTGAHA